MHEAPDGFSFRRGTERPGGCVFEVERGGAGFVCKRLPPRARAEAWMRARLEGEGAILRRLAGRGAPRWIDAGVDAAGPWLVMEHVPAAPLESRAGRVEASWVGRVATAAFAGLGGVHGAGVVHGDVSPANVLVSEEGSVTFIDFGLSIGEGMPPMPPGPFRGTLVYAAPEVARSEPFGAPADIFGLAASLLFVASGVAPRVEAPQAAMLLRAAEEPVDAWARRAASGLDPALGRALVAACAFDPRDRPDHLGVVARVP